MIAFPLTPSWEDGMVNGLGWRELEKEERAALEEEVFWKRCWPEESAEVGGLGELQTLS